MRETHTTTMRKSRCLRVANQILHFKRFGGGGCLGLDVRSRQLRSFVRFGASVKSRHSFSLRFWAVSGQSACSPETRKADLEKCSDSGAAVANISPNPDTQLVCITAIAGPRTPYWMDLPVIPAIMHDRHHKQSIVDILFDQGPVQQFG